jgi:hypothetical protein
MTAPVVATAIRWYRHPYLIPALITIISFLLFAGATVWYMTWAINQSEHDWCTMLNTLAQAPAPAPRPGNPSRIYDAKIAEDLRNLRQTFGC